VLFCEWFLLPSKTFLRLSMLLYFSVFYLFFCWIIFHCIEILNLLIYIWVDRHLSVLTSWLWVMLLWVFIYKCLCKHMFSFLFGMHIRMEFLGHMVTLCLTFWGTTDCVPKWLHIVQSNVWGFQFFPIFPNICFYQPFKKCNHLIWSQPHFEFDLPFSDD
jgi:hypothetical protein